MIRMIAAISALVLVLAAPIFTAEEPAATAPAPPKMELTTEAQKLSYFLGQNTGNYMERIQNDLEVKLDLKVFMRAIEDVLNKAEPLLTKEELTAVSQAASKKMQAKRAEQRKKREAERKVLGEKNKKEEEAFLAGNKEKPGVITTASGLQYEVLKQGTGPKPKATDRVKVNYKGTLLDGTEFDSSYSRGQPATFGVNRVVRGWTEALQLMNVGSTWRLFIPSKLGYGTRGSGAKIGPNATLIFEVELLEIEQPPLGPPAPKKVPSRRTPRQPPKR